MCYFFATVQLALNLKRALFDKFLYLFAKSQSQPCNYCEDNTETLMYLYDSPGQDLYPKTKEK